jgi:heat-inducible transcriptional repressor
MPSSSPPDPLNLTQRQQQVLWATVRHYVATAEPVGSGALVKEFNLNASAATVRNAMGVLEKVGLLYQPHTSAGRIPSDSGYRIYVDQLMQPASLFDPSFEHLFTGQLHRQNWSLEAVLRAAAQILAAVSGYVALITMPQLGGTTLHHLQLVPVDSGRVMLIIVLDTYETHSALIDLPPEIADVAASPQGEDLLERELQILSNFLNEQLRGQAIALLAEVNWQALGQEFQRYGDLLSRVLGELERRATPPGPVQLMVSGVAEVLRQPEFAELHQVQTILQLLEADQDQLVPLIFDQPAQTRGRHLTVRIGAENPLEPIRSCTLIASTYCKGSTAIGSVGLLGPTRMLYEDAIALVQASAEGLSEAMS